MTELGFVVAATIGVAVFSVTVVAACCKVSGDCAREEEKEDGK